MDWRSTVTLTSCPKQRASGWRPPPSFAAKGATVVVADMQVEERDIAARDMAGAFVRCDVSQDTDGLGAIAKAVALGKFMELVNSAGIAPAEKTVGKTGPYVLAVFEKT